MDDSARQEEVRCYPKFIAVNAAATRNEGHFSYPGRSARYAPDKRRKENRHRSNPYRKVWLNSQKSAWVIVPMKDAKACGGKDLTVTKRQRLFTNQRRSI